MTYIIRSTYGDLEICEIRGYAAAAIELAGRLEREGLQVVIEQHDGLEYRASCPEHLDQSSAGEGI